MTHIKFGVNGAPWGSLEDTGLRKRGYRVRHLARQQNAFLSNAASV